MPRQFFTAYSQPPTSSSLTSTSSRSKSLHFVLTPRNTVSPLLILFQQLSRVETKCHPLIPSFPPKIRLVSVCTQLRLLGLSTLGYIKFMTVTFPGGLLPEPELQASAIAHIRRSQEAFVPVFKGAELDFRQSTGYVCNLNRNAAAWFHKEECF